MDSFRSGSSAMQSPRVKAEGEVLGKGGKGGGGKLSEQRSMTLPGRVGWREVNK